MVNKVENVNIDEKKIIPVFKQKGFNYKQYNLDKEKYVYRWMNGEPSRMEKYFTGGYEQFLDKKGKPISRKGRNDIYPAYLMYIPKELYQQAQEEKLVEPREIEEAIKGKKIPSKQAKGMSQPLDEKNFYNTSTVKTILHQEG